MRGLRTLGVAAVASAALVAPAQAMHWPNFGHDAGRSGRQPVDPGGGAVPQAYAQKQAAVDTPVIVTSGGGALSRAQFAFGTSDGHFHHRALATGDAAGSSTDIDDIAGDPDLFGANPRAYVSAVDSSDHTAEGLTLVVHNDDNQDGAQNDQQGPDPRSGSDIAIAAIDQRTLSRVWDRGVGPITPSTTPGREKAHTIGFTINSAPVLGPRNDAGTRSLFFLASRSQGAFSSQATACMPGVSFEEPPGQFPRGCEIPAAVRLFKVDIHDAGTINAYFGDADIAAVDVPQGNPLTSPTLVNVGAQTLVAVATTNGVLRTFRTSNLTPGPVSEDLGDALFTTSIPVRADGSIPMPATELFVAAAQEATTPDTSRVYRLSVSEAAIAVEQQSEPLTGTSDTRPGIGLALTRQSEAMVPGRVIVTTAGNLFSLNAADLSDGSAYSLSGSLTAGTTGFSRTAAATQNGLVYAMNDRAEQLVLDDVTLDALPPAAFTPWPGQSYAANAAIGGPAISRGFVLFPTVDGVFAYRNQVGPSVVITSPADHATVAGVVPVTARAADPRSGIARVVFRVGESVVGEDTTPSNPDGAGAGDYSVSFDTRSVANGGYPLTAEVIDNDSGFDLPAETAVSERAIVVDNPAAAPSPSPTATAPPPAATPVPSVVPVPVARVDPAGLTARTLPRRDPRAPYRFRTSGRLLPPRGLTAQQGCGVGGRVDVQVKALRKTISTRRVNLRPDCSYSSRVTFRDARRFTRSGVLTFTVRFRGNPRLNPIRAKQHTVRTR